MIQSSNSSKMGFQTPNFSSNTSHGWATNRDITDLLYVFPVIIFLRCKRLEITSSDMDTSINTRIDLLGAQSVTSRVIAAGSILMNTNVLAGITVMNAIRTGGLLGHV